MEETAGFEPANHGFANRSFRPLRHVSLEDMVIQKRVFVKGFGKRRIGLFYSVKFFFKFGTDFEKGYFFGGNVHNFTGSGVSSLVRFIVFVGKGAEASEFNPFVVVKGLDNGVERGVDNHLCLVMGEMGPFFQCCNQFRFGHTSV